MKALAGIIAVLTALLFGVLALPTVAGVTQGGGACRIDPAALDDAGTVAGYSGEQLVNAALIMNVAQQLGLGLRGQQIGVMTAMEESTLNNLTYGDNAINPDGTIADSMGLFQQQGGWGSVADRMDPSTAARLFFDRLVMIPDWGNLPPEEAAYRVQINIGAALYAAHWDDAVEVVSELSTAAACSSTTASADGWAMPTTSPITSPYGGRADPATGRFVFHGGMDFSSGCGAPIYAMGDGVVTRVFVGEPMAGYPGANIIEVDHGNGVISWYAHMYDNGILVRQGDRVTAGQQIAAEGSSGYSTGCHLHLELFYNGASIDPIQFLQQRGVETP